MNEIIFKIYPIFQIILGGFAIILDNSDWPPKLEVLKNMQMSQYVPMKGSHLLQMFLKIPSAECLWAYYV